MVDINQFLDAGKKDIDELSVHYRTKEALYAAFMPHIKHGGALFVPSNKDYALGDAVVVDVKLMDEPQSYRIQGNIVWKTPTGAQGGMAAGIGVQIGGEQSEELRKKIDTHLAGMIHSDNRTDTM